MVESRAHTSGSHLNLSVSHCSRVSIWAAAWLDLCRNLCCTPGHSIEPASFHTLTRNQFKNRMLLSLFILKPSPDRMNQIIRFSARGNKNISLVDSVAINFISILVRLFHSSPVATAFWSIPVNIARSSPSLTSSIAYIAICDEESFKWADGWMNSKLSSW